MPGSTPIRRQVTQSHRLLASFDSRASTAAPMDPSLDGKPLSSDHSTGLVAMNAVAALAATDPRATKFVQALWDAPSPRDTGATTTACSICSAYSKPAANSRSY